MQLQRITFPIFIFVLFMAGVVSGQEETDTSKLPAKTEAPALNSLRRLVDEVLPSGNVNEKRPVRHSITRGSLDFLG